TVNQRGSAVRFFSLASLAVQVFRVTRDARRATRSLSRQSPITNHQSPMRTCHSSQVHPLSRAAIKGTSVRSGCAVGFWLLVLVIPGLAQDLEPRAYSASPIGLNFVVVGYGRSSGSVLFDPTLPITDVKATLNIPILGYGRTFGLFGRQSLVTA